MRLRLPAKLANSLVRPCHALLCPTELRTRSLQPGIGCSASHRLCPVRWFASIWPHAAFVDFALQRGGALCGWRLRVGPRCRLLVQMRSLFALL